MKIKYLGIINNKGKISNISDTLWKNKKKLKIDQLDSFFSNKDNKMFFCFLKRYKTKIYHNRDFGLFVAVLFDKEMIEIYKKENNNYEKDQEKTKNNDETLELTFIEEIKFNDLVKIEFHKEFKNVITMEVNIKKEIKEKKNLFGFISDIKNKNKNKEKKEESFFIDLDFDSFNESNLFLNSINDKKK